MTDIESPVVSALTIVAFLVGFGAHVMVVSAGREDGAIIRARGRLGVVFRCTDRARTVPVKVLTVEVGGANRSHYS
ncbi:hypothetical protein ACFTWF_30660 [Rhodococcus sp. NPDC056960]|uniref:hypothetical protein n=1 Tax=Rhodococcus sp. NPDC056960 TaxID=3345982 RepID=UPI003631A95E